MMMKKREMRVKYILGDKDKAWLTQQLISVDKRKMRRNDIYHVMQLMDNVAMERMINVLNEPTLANAKICVSECTRVRDYCNNELKKISAIDGLVVPIIQENFYTANANFSKKRRGLVNHYSNNVFKKFHNTFFYCLSISLDSNA